MVVIGVIGMVLPALFSIVFIVLQQQVKVLRLTEAKRQGDFVLNSIGAIVRTDGVAIYSSISPFSTERCAQTDTTSFSSATGDDFYFKDKNDNWFQYAFSSNTIASNSGIAGASGDLTTPKARVENFSIQCKRSARFSPPVITVRFDICYGGSGVTSCSPNGRPEETSTLQYVTDIKLRNQ